MLFRSQPSSDTITKLEAPRFADLPSEDDSLLFSTRLDRSDLQASGPVSLVTRSRCALMLYHMRSQWYGGAAPKSTARSYTLRLLLWMLSLPSQFELTQKQEWHGAYVGL